MSGHTHFISPLIACVLACCQQQSVCAIFGAWCFLRRRFVAGDPGDPGDPDDFGDPGSDPMSSLNGDPARCTGVLVCELAWARGVLGPRSGERVRRLPRRGEGDRRGDLGTALSSAAKPGGPGDPGDRC